ncbi:tyrosine-protein phosphatase Lar-like [Trichonephila clavipes]|uniref:protein-tyrosine-phosphatase n=1 Tax=Trichonephila clavipes TaxID=2585209 RepID=A0A8X6WEK2_TRICX|nr:tyrosine-protein phosphatase Lar-like [Trichonephila clavipes]
MGPKKTLERIEYSFFWESLSSNVKKFCESCKECQLTRSVRIKDRSSSTPVARPELPFEVGNMDLIGPIDPPSSKGHTYILCLVDQHTRRGEAMLVTSLRAKVTCEALLSIFSRTEIYLLSKREGFVEKNSGASWVTVLDLWKWYFCRSLTKGYAACVMPFDIYMTKKVIEVRLYSNEIQSTPLPLIPELNSGFVAAVSISAVAGVALCLLCILLVIMKQKLLQGRNSATATPTADAYSLDSLSINASFRRRRNRRSARSYLNHAFTDQEIPSHPLNEKTLTNCLKSRDLLEDEFKKIPMNMPKLDSIPEGAHVKNRYSNILPRPETRVVLAEPSGDPLKCYINANFIKGYEGKSAFYIACQAPLPEGIEDFWRMVWEQQCRVIIMLTMFEENGISRCAMYFPQSPLVSQQPYGDFQVSLLKKDVYEFYTISTLRLLDMEKNLFRDIVHLWFTGWPDVGVPKDPSSLITFVQQCRTFINCNSGPTVVHCR